MNNKLVIAAAGSGKTTHLVEEALKNKHKRVLITTYTQANETEIKKKIIEINKCIPENITIQTWFSFLLKHGVRPFQVAMYEKKIKGLLLVNQQSAPFISEAENLERHYLTPDYKLYTDKLSKFVFSCNEKTNGAVIDRISRIYPHIYIDEVQDLAGYDLELLKLLFKCKSNILLVGDPRQGTYSTNSASKNKQFKKSQIIHFFESVPKNDIEIDSESLLVNYRCIEPICTLSNKFFPALPGVKSGNTDVTEHDGIFFIKEQDVEDYLKKYKPIQLRDSRRTTVNENYPAMNFGESKGLSFNRVLIYPTKPFIEWLIKGKELAPTSCSKLYVALTRARQSVGIIYNYKNQKVEGIQNFVVNRNKEE
ncbi:MAG: UvrD-helicase domain-containing protein [Tannerellaceae bacterium]|nr:UvrD-helicase domain-containing protein [Tannerellaceae bacterium]